MPLQPHATTEHTTAQFLLSVVMVDEASLPPPPPPPLPPVGSATVDSIISIPSTSAKPRSKAKARQARVFCSRCHKSLAICSLWRHENRVCGPRKREVREKCPTCLHTYSRRDSLNRHLTKPGPCFVVSPPPTSTPSTSDSPGPTKVPRTHARTRHSLIIPRTSRAPSLLGPTSSSISPLTEGPTVSPILVAPNSPAEQPPSTPYAPHNLSQGGGCNQYGHVTPHYPPTSPHPPTLPPISNISSSDNHQRGSFHSQTSISASQIPPSLYHDPGYQANSINLSWNSNSSPPRFSSGSNQHSWGASLQYTHPTYLSMTPALPTSNDTRMLCQARNSYPTRQPMIDGIQYSHATSQVNHPGQQKMADGTKPLPIFAEGPQSIFKSLIHPHTQENYATPHRLQPIPEPPIHNFSYRAGYARFHELQPISKPPTYTFAQENCRDVGDYAHGPQPSPTSEYSESSTCIPAQGHYAYHQTIPEYDSSSFLDAPPSIPGLPKFWPTRFNPESHPLL